MTEQSSYTTEEIAKLLRVSKLTVYDLIKKGEMPAYRVGKQMRVDHQDLEEYKAKSRAGTAASDFVPVSVGEPNPRHHPLLGPRPLVITGQDSVLDILAKYIEKDTRSVRPLRSPMGSLDSLISMYRGESDVVSTHLFDGDTGEYNLPYIRRILIGYPYVVVNLVSRTAGLYVQKDNPRSLNFWKDLGQPGLTLVNREKGSGARVLLDEQLRVHNIAVSRLKGYGNEESNHLGVAGKVASGLADVGVGTEKAAAAVGVDFVPLVKERYDLVMIKKQDNLEWIEMVKRILNSPLFKEELRSIGGYDLSQTGEVLWETE
jgi:putative molybdopterin biosynthesis protein